MKFSLKYSGTVLPLLCSFVAAPLFAQTQIGGGTCNSSSLKGNFAVSINGRQVTAAAAYANVFQANGLVNFDGQSAISFSLSANTLQSVGTPLNWSGTYTMQANCSGTITINSGGSATFSLVVYNDENGQGLNFLLGGSDATYSYNGTGNTQPANCSTALLSGPYAFATIGFNNSHGAGVSGLSNSIGVLQFDGQGNVTGSIAGVNAATLPVSGTYSVNSNCLGTGLSSTASFSVYSGNATAITDAYILTGAPSTSVASGTGSGGLHTLSGLTCNAATLNGTYSLTLNGRAGGGTITGYFQGNGTVTFDGQGNVTLTGTSNSDKGIGKSFSYSGTYAMPSNCLGTMSFMAASGPATITVVPYGGGKQFAFSGNDNTYTYSASGYNLRPVACSTATLSGPYTFEASGFSLSGAAINGNGDATGLLQFDGQGNVTATDTTFAPGTQGAAKTQTGTYSVTSGCLASATLTSTNNTNTLTFSLQNLYAQGGILLWNSSTFAGSGSIHAAFVNPSQAIGNVASYAVNATPPGSVFVLFGQNLATREAGASNVPLSTTLLTTSVTVNGEAAPLFYVNTGQIDAQMPWDVATGALATVIVKNGTSTSNAAAVFVPATGTPGISVYGNNRAVVVNANGSVNAGDAPAKVGDEVVAYFTGGGPVTAAGKLTSGAASPNGLSPISGSSSITVGTAAATVQYIGLTPGGIGLYQANFTVPQLAKGTYPLVITIAGQASNNPVMTVTN